MDLQWTSLDTWITVAGIFSAINCALLGNFLVLRKMSMMGDAISHAVLPGLAVAFIVTGSRTSLPMFIGAAIVGVLTAVFTQAVNRYGRVEESASMGVVFTSLFAVGLILLVRAADSVDLDPGCVLYGAIELVPLDTWSVGPMQIPRVVIILTGILILNGAVIGLLFKEFKISSFDPELSTSLGINANKMHYLLMTLVAVTTVACFESVGSILVIAMLIVPAATAHLLTDRLKTMIIASLALASLSAISGHLAAISLPQLWGYTDTNSAGMMATASGVIFFFAFILSPRHGLLSKMLNQLRIGLRIAREDLLGVMYRLDEHRATMPTREILKLLTTAKQTPPWMGKLASLQLANSGLLEEIRGTLQLTSTGKSSASNLVRSHRLWESYLARHLIVPLDHLHSTAEKLEHITNPVMQRRLADKLSQPVNDPHGKAIPKVEE